MIHAEVAVFVSLLGVALVSMVPYALGPGRAGISPDGSARKGSPKADCTVMRPSANAEASVA